MKTLVKRLTSDFSRLQYFSQHFIFVLKTTLNIEHIICILFTTGYCYFYHMEALLDNIQTLTNNLNCWTMLNGMVIHPRKSILILSKINMENKQSQIVSNYKVLVIDNKLNLSNQITVTVAVKLNS